MQRKSIGISRLIENQTASQYYKQNYDNSIENYFKIEKNQKSSIEWAKKNVPIFENILIDLARDYEKDTGKKLKSAKGYAG